MNEEIKNKALNFIANHKDDKDETQQAQQFVRDFISIFNENQARVGYEFKVKVNGASRRIDYLWAGVLLIEMKGAKVQSFDEIEAGHTTSPVSQAERYYHALDDKDKPKYIMVCNFERIRLYDLSTDGEFIEFATVDLMKHLDDFSFLLGKKSRLTTGNIDPVNEKAAVLLEKIHTLLLEAHYPRNYADLLMTRLVFCLFADDTQIFQNNQFEDFLETTAENGSDLVNRLANLFKMLNTPEENRFKGQEYSEFPYINGGLFKLEQLSGLPLTAEIRENLIKISELNWAKISPVIFGSMFEGAMDKTKRHALGAHYTSEKNILKVIDSLFLDDLREEFEKVKAYKRGREAKLEEFHEKLANLKFLDPACGSGNFLIVAYRELRKLEHEVIFEQTQGVMSLFDIKEMIKVEVAQFYGIEIVPYATSVARLGLWLMDHIMNLEASTLFGAFYARLPLHNGGNIVNADALKVDWLTVFNDNQKTTYEKLSVLTEDSWAKRAVSSEEIEFVRTNKFDFVLGNPPFIGDSVMTKEQKETLVSVTKTYTKSKKLDFVSGWYFKTAELMEQNHNLQAALVSTNSVTQGVQATEIWQPMFEKLGIKINFAHQTFKWDNNGAAVFVVIIGFANFDKENKILFSYQKVTDEAVRTDKVKNINQYLLPAPSIFIKSESKQVSGLPEMYYGSKPVDGGNYIFTEDEKDEFIKLEPKSAPYIKLFVGAQELMNGKNRFMLYVKEIPLTELRSMKLVQERIKNVRELRLDSKKKATQEMGNRATELAEDRYVNSKLMCIPSVSSGNREYAPVGFFSENTIIANSAFQLENATPQLFSLLQSKLHMAWLDTVGGRLKGDYRYSNTLVYNTFVVPKLTDETVSALTASAEQILQVCKAYSVQGNSLADMYDPLLMPADLRKAHNANDKLVDSIYGLKNPTKEERVARLMEMYLEERNG